MKVGENTWVSEWGQSHYLAKSFHINFTENTNFYIFLNWPNFFLRWNWKLRLQIWAVQGEFIWCAILFLKIFSKKYIFIFEIFFLKYFRKFLEFSEIFQKIYFENKKYFFWKDFEKKITQQMNSPWKTQICNLSF